MRDSTKKRVAQALLGVTIVVLLLGIYRCVDAFRLHSRLKANEGRNALELSADLSKAGVYTGRFVGLHGIAHAVNVYITLDEGVKAPAECDALLAPVVARWRSTEPDGKTWLDQEFVWFDWDRKALYPRKRMLLLRVHGYPEGDSAVTLTVDTPSLALAERSYKVTAEHEYCGLEYLIATVSGLVGGGLALLSLVPFAIRRAIRRKLNSSATSTGDAGTAEASRGESGGHE